MMPGSKALLVLGMHRSGTSATSGALARFGFDLGPRLVAAADDNPKGYFEHEPVVAIHEAFLEALGRRWCDPTRLPSSAWHGAPAEVARSAILDAVREDFHGAAKWALKDPRLSRLLPLWQPLWPMLGVETSALVVIRRPVEVAGSLARRDGFPLFLADLLWVRHTLEALRGTTAMPRTCIEYANLVADPHGCLTAALAHLGLPAPESTTPALVGFVDATLNHHAAARRDIDDPMGRLADELFDACVAMPEGPPATWLSSFERRLDEATVTLDGTMEAGAAAFREVVVQAARWRDDGYATKSALHAQIQWSDAAARQLAETQHHAAESRLALEEERRVSEALRRDLALVESLVRAREQERDALIVARDTVRHDLNLVLGSRSWRWTAPFRRFAGHFARIFR